jgi:hypothetical protein
MLYYSYYFTEQDSLLNVYLIVVQNVYVLALSTIVSLSLYCYSDWLIGGQ